MGYLGLCDTDGYTNLTSTPLVGVWADLRFRDYVLAGTWRQSQVSFSRLISVSMSLDPSLLYLNHSFTVWTLSIKHAQTRCYSEEGFCANGPIHP